MPKQRLRLVSSTNFVGKKKRNLQNYFDTNPHQPLTPVHSLPKRKTLHKNKSKPKNSYKQSLANKNQSFSRKQSANKAQRKIQFSPSHNQLKSHKKSAHKNSKLQHQHYREYDSPARQQEQMDLILSGNHTRKQKSNGYVNQVIDKVNQDLKGNNVEQAVQVLAEALHKHPTNFDLNYLLGICYLINSSFSAALQVFQKLLKIQPRKNIYLLLSVCYKKAQNYELTQQILDLCLEKYPKYYQAYIYRGKLYLKLKNYKKAYQDFQKAMILDSHKQMAIIGKGDCLRLMQKYQEAKVLYIQALKQSGSQISSLLLRKAICGIQMKKYDGALEDINRILQADPSNSQALYFKGLILSKQRNTNQALICYEQAIKHNSNKKAVTRALYEITKLKIENRDFYQALYNLERAQFLDIDERVVKKFKIFIEGATSMMKKNYNEGIRILTELANDSEKPMSNFLKPLFYSCRSFGYMSLQKFVLAKEDLDTLERQFALDLPNLYNKFICEGILACGSVKYQQALAYFSKAGKAQPHRVEPFFYKAVTLICFAHKLLPRQMSEKKMEYIESAMKTLQKTSLPIENNPSLFLVRGFLHYSQGNLQAAIEDLQACLNESVKPIPLVFYLNGLVLAQAGKYNEAVHEFKRALEGDEKHKIPEIYLKRAQCMILMGQINNGFQDLQSYMSYQPTSPDIHIWAGHLLFHIGACEDAAKAYSNLNSISKNPQVLEYRAKCYLASKDVISTVNDLRQILQLNYTNPVYFDCELLEALRQCSQQNFQDYSLMLGRIKKAKNKVIQSQKHLQSLGRIFGWAEYQFYKAVLYFYMGNYEGASKNFKRAQELMQQKIEEDIQTDERLIEYYKNSFHHAAFNFFQIRYNIAIAQIMTGNLAKASRYLKEIAKRAEQQGQQELFSQMELLISLISQETLKKFQGTQTSKKQQKIQDQEAEFLPFPSENRLCSIFPDFLMNFSQPVRTKLFFCLPYVAKPDISVKFQFKIMEHFDMSIIQTKPEAPWIRRSEQGVIFTDQVVRYDVELSQSSQSSQQEEDSNYEQQRHDHSEQGTEEQEEQIQFNPRKLREMLELDPATKERLSKIK